MGHLLTRGVSMVESLKKLITKVCSENELFVIDPVLHGPQFKSIRDQNLENFENLGSIRSEFSGFKTVHGSLVAMLIIYTLQTADTKWNSSTAFSFTWTF